MKGPRGGRGQCEGGLAVVGVKGSGVVKGEGVVGDQELKGSMGSRGQGLKGV